MSTVKDSGHSLLASLDHNLKEVRRENVPADLHQCNIFRSDKFISSKPFSVVNVIFTGCHYLHFSFQVQVVLAFLHVFCIVFLCDVPVCMPIPLLQLVARRLALSLSPLGGRRHRLCIYCFRIQQFIIIAFEPAVWSFLGTVFSTTRHIYALLIK